jgi:hypothetical protein
MRYDCNGEAIRSEPSHPISVRIQPLAALNPDRPRNHAACTLEEKMKLVLVAAAILLLNSTALAAECMPCQAKCAVCFNAGKSTYSSVAACEADCRKAGNPMALATCGVRAKCPQ